MQSHGPVDFCRFCGFHGNPTFSSYILHEIIVLNIQCQVQDKNQCLKMNAIIGLQASADRF